MPFSYSRMRLCSAPRPSSLPRPSDDSARHALRAAATSASIPALVVASTTKPSRSDSTAHCTPSIAVNCARIPAAASVGGGGDGIRGDTGAAATASTTAGGAGSVAVTIGTTGSGGGGGATTGGGGGGTTPIAGGGGAA